MEIEHIGIIVGIIVGVAGIISGWCALYLSIRSISPRIALVYIRSVSSYNDILLYSKERGRRFRGEWSAAFASVTNVPATIVAASILLHNRWLRSVLQMYLEGMSEEFSSQPSMKYKGKFFVKADPKWPIIIEPGKCKEDIKLSATAFFKETKHCDNFWAEVNKQLTQDLNNCRFYLDLKCSTGKIFRFNCSSYT